MSTNVPRLLDLLSDDDAFPLFPSHLLCSLLNETIVYLAQGLIRSYRLPNLTIHPKKMSFLLSLLGAEIKELRVLSLITLSLILLSPKNLRSFVEELSLPFINGCVLLNGFAGLAEDEKMNSTSGSWLGDFLVSIDNRDQYLPSSEHNVSLFFFVMKNQNSDKFNIYSPDEIFLVKNFSLQSIVMSIDQQIVITDVPDPAEVPCGVEFKPAEPKILTLPVPHKPVFFNQGSDSKMTDSYTSGMTHSRLSDLISSLPYSEQVGSGSKSQSRSKPLKFLSRKSESIVKDLFFRSKQAVAETPRSIHPPRIGGRAMSTDASGPLEKASPYLISQPPGEYEKNSKPVDFGKRRTTVGASNYFLGSASNLRNLVGLTGQNQKSMLHKSANQPGNARTNPPTISKTYNDQQALLIHKKSDGGKAKNLPKLDVSSVRKLVKSARDGATWKFPSVLK